MATLLDILMGNQQTQPNTAQQILSSRDNISGNDNSGMMPSYQMSGQQQPMQPMIPSAYNDLRAGIQNQIGYGYNPRGYRPITGEDLQNQQLQGQSEMLHNQILGATGMQMAKAQLDKQLLENNITNQTGLQSAQADLAHKMMLNDIMGKTGLSAAQADIALHNAQANYYGNALERDIAEKRFEYANDPAKAMARAMGEYMQNMGGFSGSNPSNISTPSGEISPINASDLDKKVPSQQISNPPTPDQLNQQSSIPQQIQQNAQNNGPPRFNPMGALLAKQFGLDNMQIGPNGQPQMIPGVITPGQREQDNNFAQSWQTYVNEGGDKRLQNSLDTIDLVINKLKKGDVETGGRLSRAMTNPEGQPIEGAQLVNPDALVARNLIASSILPQAKALFGARVTNFDAQSLISSQGLDLMADNNTNIEKLQRLKNATLQAQKELKSAGKFFTQNGTLAGYNPEINNQPQTQPQNNDPLGIR